MSSSPTPPYDPYIPSGGQSSQPPQDERTHKVKRELNSAVDTLKKNAEMLQTRGENLDSLRDKTDNLATEAQGFRRGANRVRKQMWWKDMKMRIWLGIGIIVLLAIIIIPAVVTTRGN